MRPSRRSLPSGPHSAIRNASLATKPVERRIRTPFGEVKNFCDKYDKPLNDELVAKGTLAAVAIHVEGVHTESPFVRLVVSLAIKATLALSFPLLLLALRFFDERELHRISEIWQKLAATLRRRRLTEVS